MGALLVVASGVEGSNEDPAREWQFGLAIYGWLPSLSGELNYPVPGTEDGISVDADQIIDALKMTFMGSFEARKGNWSGFTDLIYLDLEGDQSKSVSLPNDSTRTLLDADGELTGWIWTLAGAYTPWRDKQSYLDLFAGARLLSLETDLKLTGGGPLRLERKLSASKDFWDAIVGVKGRVGLNERWFLPYYADIGTGDTDLTWQMAAGVGYVFDWGQATLKYRYLEYDQDDDGLMQNVGFGGVELGVGFRF